jgi:hypothetical protein
MADEHGQWYFQNGPQRVFVELLAAPFVWRIHDDWSVWSASGHAQQVLHCVVDEAGRVYLSTPAGLGLVFSQDVGLVADALSAGHWEEKKIRSSELERIYRFVKSPLQRAAQII